MPESDVFIKLLQQLIQNQHRQVNHFRLLIEYSIPFFDWLTSTTSFHTNQTTTITNLTLSIEQFQLLSCSTFLSNSPFILAAFATCFAQSQTISALFTNIHSIYSILLHPTINLSTTSNSNQTTNDNNNRSNPPDLSYLQGVHDKVLHGFIRLLLNPIHSHYLLHQSIHHSTIDETLLDILSIQSNLSQPSPNRQDNDILIPSTLATPTTASTNLPNIPLTTSPILPARTQPPPPPSLIPPYITLPLSQFYKNTTSISQSTLISYQKLTFHIFLYILPHCSQEGILFALQLLLNSSTPTIISHHNPIHIATQSFSATYTQFFKTVITCIFSSLWSLVHSTIYSTTVDISKRRQIYNYHYGDDNNNISKPIQSISSSKSTTKTTSTPPNSTKLSDFTTQIFTNDVDELLTPTVSSSSNNIKRHKQRSTTTSKSTLVSNNTTTKPPSPILKSSTHSTPKKPTLKLSSRCSVQTFDLDDGNQSDEQSDEFNHSMINQHEQSQQPQRCSTIVTTTSITSTPRQVSTINSLTSPSQQDSLYIAHNFNSPTTKIQIQTNSPHSSVDNSDYDEQDNDTRHQNNESSDDNDNDLSAPSVKLSVTWDDSTTTATTTHNRSNYSSSLKRNPIFNSTCKTHIENECENIPNDINSNSIPQLQSTINNNTNTTNTTQINSVLQKSSKPRMPKATLSVGFDLTEHSDDDTLSLDGLSTWSNHSSIPSQHQSLHQQQNQLTTINNNASTTNNTPSTPLITTIHLKSPTKDSIHCQTTSNTPTISPMPTYDSTEIDDMNHNINSALSQGKGKGIRPARKLSAFFSNTVSFRSIDQQPTSSNQINQGSDNNNNTILVEPLFPTEDQDTKFHSNVIHSPHHFRDTTIELSYSTSTDDSISTSSSIQNPPPSQLQSQHNSSIVKRGVNFKFPSDSSQGTNDNHDDNNNDDTSHDLDLETDYTILSFTETDSQMLYSEHNDDNNGVIKQRVSIPLSLHGGERTTTTTSTTIPNPLPRRNSTTRPEHITIDPHHHLKSTNSPVPPPGTTIPQQEQQKHSQLLQQQSPPPSTRSSSIILHGQNRRRKQQGEPNAPRLVARFREEGDNLETYPSDDDDNDIHHVRLIRGGGPLHFRSQQSYYSRHKSKKNNDTFNQIDINDQDNNNGLLAGYDHSDTSSTQSSHSSRSSTQYHRSLHKQSSVSISITTATTTTTTTTTTTNQLLQQRPLSSSSHSHSQSSLSSHNGSQSTSRVRYNIQPHLQHISSDDSDHGDRDSITNSNGTERMNNESLQESDPFDIFGSVSELRFSEYLDTSSNYDDSDYYQENDNELCHDDPLLYQTPNSTSQHSATPTPYPSTNPNTTGKLLTPLPTTTTTSTSTISTTNDNSKIFNQYHSQHQIDDDNMNHVVANNQHDTDINSQHSIDKDETQSQFSLFSHNTQAFSHTSTELAPLIQGYISFSKIHRYYIPSNFSFLPNKLRHNNINTNTSKLLPTTKYLPTQSDHRTSPTLYISSNSSSIVTSPTNPIISPTTNLSPPISTHPLDFPSIFKSSSTTNYPTPILSTTEYHDDNEQHLSIQPELSQSTSTMSPSYVQSASLYTSSLSHTRHTQTTNTISSSAISQISNQSQPPSSVLQLPTSSSSSSGLVRSLTISPLINNYNNSNINNPKQNQYNLHQQRRIRRFYSKQYKLTLPEIILSLCEYRLKFLDIAQCFKSIVLFYPHILSPFNNTLFINCIKKPCFPTYLHYICTNPSIVQTETITDIFQLLFPHYLTSPFTIQTPLSSPTLPQTIIQTPTSSSLLTTQPKLQPNQLTSIPSEYTTIHPHEQDYQYQPLQLQLPTNQSNPSGKSETDLSKYLPTKHLPSPPPGLLTSPPTPTSHDHDHQQQFSKVLSNTTSSTNISTSALITSQLYPSTQATNITKPIPTTANIPNSIIPVQSSDDLTYQNNKQHSIQINLNPNASFNSLPQSTPLGPAHHPNGEDHIPSIDLMLESNCTSNSSTIFNSITTITTPIHYNDGQQQEHQLDLQQQQYQQHQTPNSTSQPYLEDIFSLQDDLEYTILHHLCDKQFGVGLTSARVVDTPFSSDCIEFILEQYVEQILILHPSK